MNKLRRFAIVGSRSFNNYYIMYKVLKEYLPQKALIISGEADGADTLAYVYAMQNGYLFDGYPAKWDEYGKAAGMKRNVDMIQNSDNVIAFWNGKSPGTKNFVDLAKKKNIPSIIIDVLDNDIIRPHPGRVVHVNKEPYDVYIGRGNGSIFGNPFVMSKTYNRLQVISMYMDYLLKTPSILEKIFDLKDKVLGCYCSPKLCHGDAICWLLDNVESELKNHISSFSIKTERTYDRAKKPQLLLEDALQLYPKNGVGVQVYTNNNLVLAFGYKTIIEDNGRLYFEVDDKDINKDSIRMTMKERERVNNEDVTRAFWISNDSCRVAIWNQKAEFYDSCCKPKFWYIPVDNTHI